MTCMARQPGLYLALCVSLMVAGCRQDAATEAGPGATASGERLSVAFVTNQIASFWNIAKVGCEDAGKEFDVDVHVHMPHEATAVEQKRIVQDLVSSGIGGIAISPIDADNQKELINQVAAEIPLLTHDSDAPDTDRLMYIGMDNYSAGRMCGKLVKEALPDGGNVMLFIGRLEQDNSKRRRQGVIDELLDRLDDASRFDPVEGVISGEKYNILGTLTDQGKTDVAKRKAEDAINTYPEMDAMVGLFAYNPPACLQALKQADKLGKVKLIGFDEADETLQGIKDGNIQGTVVQDPYQYGYQSIQVLTKYIRGDQEVIPDSKFIDIPARMVTSENVDEFWADLKAKTGG